MQRRTIAVTFALFAASATLAQVTWYLDAGRPLSGTWGSLASSLTRIVLATAIPTIGAVLLARRRETGVAVLVAVGLAAVPTLISLPRFLVSAGGAIWACG